MADPTGPMPGDDLLLRDIDRDIGALEQAQLQLRYWQYLVDTLTQRLEAKVALFHQRSSTVTE